ncbi:MAG: fumarylacetoacetate hydrolase family protein [Bacillaceae bacterium]|nr:fumarylacetoacetate hydrolase family protein [Bacillaceae bacterium]
MRLGTVKKGSEEVAAIVTEKGVVLVETVNNSLHQNWSTTLFELIQTGQLEEMNDWYRKDGKNKLEELEVIPHQEVVYGPLYRRPRKIWGIGLNYVEHASDLSEKAPDTEPASFMKPDTTIIGPRDTIKIPVQSEQTTAEAELGIIFGRECKDVSEAEAKDYMAGYTCIIDMTAEDILRKNPRYLTRSKSFDTFFSFGPHLITPDEVEDVLQLEVATVINGKIHRKNVVANMTFRPWDLVSFHSKVMPWLPGDILSTGTPGAVPISDGDVVECRINGFETLVNKVKDLKVDV